MKAIKHDGADGDGDIRVQVTSVRTSCCLRLPNLAESEREWLRFCGLWGLGDLWLPEDTSLELEVFLAVVESGCLGVEVVELHPQLQ